MTNYNRIATTNTNVGSRTAENESLISVLLSLPAALWQFICALGLGKVVKGVSLTACIFVFFGIVGGIEAGVISFGLGIVLVALIACIEILCLKQKT
ncbi:MAG: hypothetical protein IIW17_06710 [Clostridia bacterium]|nr:hypothetical protein [Clostridia bacterium]MBQ5793693.1 hypothetical protein [Clostridia bacterium]